VAEPADTTIIEFIKTAGGIAGLASAAFLIWDRLVRGRPLAELSAIVRTSGTPADPCIRIVNPGTTGLLIRSVRVLPAGIYAVAKNFGIKPTMAALGDTTVKDANILNVVLLRPGQEHDLAIIDRRKDEDARKNISRRVCFCIYWRKNSSTWLPQLPVFIFTSIAGIQRIVAATSQ
jgi:hypothetical protein